jgi:CheY-like chemotaxis protein
VVADESMPGITGTELLTQVREAYPNIVRMMLTAHASPHVAEKARTVAAVEYVFVKPCSPVVFRDAVRQALHRRNQAR